VPGGFVGEAFSGDIDRRELTIKINVEYTLSESQMMEDIVFDLEKIKSYKSPLKC
jgi:hypothetical protein